MKNYVVPEMEVVLLDVENVITDSPVQVGKDNVEDAGTIFG